MIQKFYFWVELKPGASNRYLHTDVHNSFIHDSQKVEITHVSIKKWMDKQNVFCSHHGILFNL